MFSYIARMFRAFWAIICVYLALVVRKASANVDLDVPSATSDAGAGIDVYGTSPMAQITAQPLHTEGDEELRYSEEFEDPAFDESRDITSRSSLFSLGQLSTIEEVEEEEDLDLEDQDAGANAMADIVRTTWMGTLEPLKDELEGNNEDKDASASLYQSNTEEYEEYECGASLPRQHSAQFEDAEDDYKTGLTTSAGHYDFKILLESHMAQEDELIQEDEDFDILMKSNEITPASSLYSLGRLSTIEEVDEEDEDNAADQEVGAEIMEEDQIARVAWKYDDDNAVAPSGLYRREFTGDKDTEGSYLALESPTVQVDVWRQLVHEAFDSDANSPFSFPATHAVKKAEVTFDDWSKSSFVSSSPTSTRTHESPNRHTSPTSQGGRCDASRQLHCSPLLIPASSPSLSATSSTSSLIATPTLGTFTGFGYYPLELVMPSSLGSPGPISGEFKMKSFGPGPSFVPDVFYDVNAEECAKSTVPAATAITVATVEVGADVLFPAKMTGSVSFTELLGHFPAADKLFEGIPSLGSFETLYLKPAVPHQPEPSITVTVPASISSVEPAVTTIAVDSMPTCSSSRAIFSPIGFVDPSESNHLEFPAADRLFEGIPSLGSFETLYLKPALPRQPIPSIPITVQVIPPTDKPAVTTIGDTTIHVRADSMPPSSSSRAIIQVGFVDDSESDRLEDGLIPTMVSHSVGERGGYEQSLAGWIFLCLLLLPSLTFSSFISSLL